MTDYPFIVRGKVNKVKGSSYRNALDRVLEKNRNQFVKTKFAKTMDLITAKEEAKTASKTNKKARTFVVADSEGEFDLSTIIKKGETAYAVFIGGKEVSLTEDEKAGATSVPVKNLVSKPTVEIVRGSMAKIIKEHQKIVTKNQKEMAKPIKAVPAKKENKTAKVAGLTYRATRVGLTDAQWKKFDASGQKLQALASEFAAAKFK